MADKTLYDVNGNPVGLQASAQVPQAPQAKAFFDLHGNPLDLSKTPIGTQPSPAQWPPEAEPTSYAARLASESLPFVGSFEGPLGVAAGALAKNLLKYSVPGVFGEGPRSGLGLAADVGGEELGQFVIPKALGAAAEGAVNLARRGLPGLISSRALRAFPAVREGAVRQMTQQLMEGYKLPESQILEQGAQQAGQRAGAISGSPIESSGPLDLFGKPLSEEAAVAQPNYKSWSKSFKQLPAAQPAGGSSVENKVGDLLLQLDKEVKEGADIARSQTYKQISNLTLSDLTHVRNAKLATGSLEFTNNLALNKLLGSGEESLNAKALLKELNGPKGEIYSEAMEPQTRAAFIDSLKEIDKQESDHEISNRLLRVSQGHLLWAIPATFGGHIFTGVGAATTGTILTNEMLKRVMANPETARLVVQALRTSASAPEASLLRKAIETSAKGAGAAGMAAVAQ